MRDIRDDLRERASLLEERIKAAQGQFEKYVEQLKSEHGSRIEVLKSALDTVNLLIGIEQRRHGTPSAAPQPEQPARNEVPLRAAVADNIGMRRAV